MGLQQSAALQQSIREILHWGVDTWRNTLCLEDEQIQHLLSHVKGLITSFQECHGDIQQTACAGKQWELLRSVVMGTDVWDCLSVPDKKKTQKICTPRAGAKLKELAVVAIQRLGNE